MRVGSVRIRLYQHNRRRWYLAVIPAEENHDVLRTEVSILKSVEEDGEPVLYAVEDPDELETVYGLVMDSLYEEEDE